MPRRRWGSRAARPQPMETAMSRLQPMTLDLEYRFYFLFISSNFLFMLFQLVVRQGRTANQRA